MKLNNQLSIFVARRRWLKRRCLNLLPSIAHSPIFNNYNFHFDPRDLRGPSFHFAYDLEKGFNNYELESKNELLKLTPPNGCFLDVGANIGMFSVYFAKNRKDVRIFCFEPDKTAHNCLQKNLGQFESQITIYKKGLSDRAQEKHLYKSNVNDGGHSFLENQLDEEGDVHESEQVAVDSLDNLRENNQVDLPDVIKIDVEGYELVALRGMVETIKLSKPVMLIESNNEDLSNKGEFWQFMSELVTMGLYARVPGQEVKMNMDELSKQANKELCEGRKISNYLFLFK